MLVYAGQLFELTDRIAFFNEHVDIAVDGTPLERPVTPWSPR